MIKDLKEYSLDYLVLIALLLAGATIYLYFHQDQVMQRIVALGMGLTYVLWGIIHHHRADKVTTKVVLEYVLIAVFGYLVINGLLIGR